MGDSEWRDRVDELLGICRWVVLIVGKFENPGAGKSRLRQLLHALTLMASSGHLERRAASKGFGVHAETTGLAWEVCRILNLETPEKAVLIVPPIDEAEENRRWEQLFSLSDGTVRIANAGVLAAKFTSTRNILLVTGARRTPEAYRAAFYGLKELDAIHGSKGRDPATVLLQASTSITNFEHQSRRSWTRRFKPGRRTTCPPSSVRSSIGRGPKWTVGSPKASSLRSSRGVRGITMHVLASIIEVLCAAQAAVGRQPCP